MYEQGFDDNVWPLVEDGGAKDRGSTTMRREVIRWSLAVLAVCATVTPLRAHHSFAMFDLDRFITLKGTVTEFHWINPHAHIILQVPRGPVSNRAGSASGTSSRQRGDHGCTRLDEGGLEARRFDRGAGESAS